LSGTPLRVRIFSAERSAPGGGGRLQRRFAAARIGLELKDLEAELVQVLAPPLVRNRVDRKGIGRRQAVGRHEHAQLADARAASFWNTPGAPASDSTR
jgi:hypothetical protein